MSDLRWFDANNTPPAQTFDLLPAGDYTCIIEADEMKDTRDGLGKRLNLTFQVLTGPHKGRKLWEGLNIVNRSDKAQEIARGQLSAICRAVGVLTPNDTSELHNKPLIVSVGIGVNKETGENQNRVKGFKPMAGTPAVPTRLEGAPKAPAPAANGVGSDADIPF